MKLICLVYSPARMKATARILSGIRQRFSERLTGIVVVSNNGALSEDDVRRFVPGDFSFVAHDNSGMEFGGYQAGLDRVAAHGPDDVLIMNDTLGSHDHWGRNKLRCFARVVANHRQNGVVAGHVQCGEQSIVLKDRHASHWIRSNLFFIDRVALEAVDGRLYYPEIDELVSDDPGSGTFFDPSLDPVAVAFLEWWLFSGDPDAWYGSRPLTDENWRFMALKARSILQERYVSMLLADAKVSFLHTYVSPIGQIADQMEEGLGKVRSRIVR